MTGRGSGSDPIDFASLAAALLDRADALVAQWLPGGVRRGHEWVCGSLGGEPGSSCSVNLTTGQWADFAGDDRGSDLIALYAAIEGLNNGQAARKLMAELGWSKPSAAAEKQEARPSSNGGDARPEPPVADADAAPRRTPRKSMWRAIVPVPASAPAPTFEHWDRPAEALQRTWEYRFEGELYGYVARFRTSDGGKDILPYTWCVDESDGRGTRRWHWKQWDEPRPLYVPATLLSGDLSLPVVLVEGEKCALAGHELLGHEFDFVSWPGGGKAWARASWGWLKGRAVYLWPDCDAKRFALSKAERETGVDPSTKELLPAQRQPGTAAMVGIGSLLLAEHGCTVFMCPIPKPGAVSDGWDIADAIAQGWDAAQVRDFIRSARAFVAPDDPVRAKAGHSSGAGASPPTTAAAGRPGEVAAESEQWLEHLLRSASSGAVKTVRENVVLALDGWPDRQVPGIAACAGLLRFNEFSNTYEKTRPTPWGSPAGDWQEADELLMGDWLMREHRMPSMSRQALEEAVIIVGRRHSYHPLRQQVQGLRGRWDRTKRLDTWLRRVYLEEDEWDDREPLQQYLTLAGRWFLMAMCARVMDEVRVGGEVRVGPGTKFDYMLVLEGPTGWGKSTAAKVMGGQYFADTGLDVTNKDSLMNIQGVWAYEWSELDQLAKQDLGAIKRFISSPVDRFRATFDRRPAAYPRQVVFIGTTEEANYLQDHKGNRRFWPVRVTRPPDLAWLRDHREQLLAEAVARVDALEPFWPDRRQQRELFDPQQAGRTIESSLEGAIRFRLFDEDQKPGLGDRNWALVDEFTLTELLTVCGFSIDKQTDAIVKKAGSVLHALHFDVKRSSRPGRPRVYVRPPRSAGKGPGASNDFAPEPSPPGHDTAEALDDCPF